MHETGLFETLPYKKSWCYLAFLASYVQVSYHPNLDDHGSPQHLTMWHTKDLENFIVKMLCTVKFQKDLIL